MADKHGNLRSHDSADTEAKLAKVIGFYEEWFLGNLDTPDFSQSINDLKTYMHFNKLCTNCNKKLLTWIGIFENAILGRDIREHVVTQMRRDENRLMVIDEMPEDDDGNWVIAATLPTEEVKDPVA